MRRGRWFLIGAGVGLAAVLGFAAWGPTSATDWRDAALPTMAVPFGGDRLDFLILAGLGVTALAIVAALVSMVRLRRAFSLQRAIFGAVPQPRQVVDRTGRTLLANDAFYDFFGPVDRPTPELLAEEVADDEDARDQLERLATKAYTGTAGYIELRVRPRVAAGGEGSASDAAPEWRYVAAHPVPGRPGSVYWMVDDITLRRQMEQVVQEEQDRFLDLLEYAPIGFYSVNEDGQFLFANHTLCDWLGLSYEDLENGMIRLHDLVDDPDLKGVPAHVPFRDADATGGEVHLKDSEDSAFLASISQDVVVGENGRTLRTRSAVRNRSHERAVAEALERSVQRFERFFLEAPVGIALLDLEGGITECNMAFCALTGLESEKLAGTSLFDLLRESDREAVRAALDQSDDAERTAVHAPVEAHLLCGDGIVSAVYINRITDLGGAASGFIAHFIDTTEQKNLEIQFVQSQKMQAVGQLAGGIAHDFNNLLTAMIGFSDLLLLRHRPGDQSFADIMQIKQNANRAANLVRQLLAFSRQQTLQPRTLDVTDILAELSHLLRRLIGENIELKMVHGRDLGPVRADQGQLEQVIINLAVNARDAMRGGGTLTIKTENRTITATRKFRGEAMPPGDYVVLEVADTGCGIAAENLDRIFDPFFSTKEVGAGTGLGLSTVYGIVKQTGGFVEVSSAEGKGATFSIFLPHYQAQAAPEAEADETAARARRDLTGMGTILLVEDEDAVRSFGARALRNKGYEVLEARSGESALEILDEQGDAIDLLVTDVVMPGVDGPTLVRKVRESLPDLKVVFISGYTEDAFRQKLGEDERMHFLPKPFSLKQLAGKVKEMLADGAAPAAGGVAEPRTPTATAAETEERHGTGG